MKKRELDRFARRLKEDKAKILNRNDISASQDDFTLNQDDLADEVDLASSELNQSLTIFLRGRERSLLKKIEDALSRIETGTFGICLDCEEPIEPKRLEARPVATLCIQCKEAEEQSERAFA